METVKENKGWIVLGITTVLLLTFFVYQNKEKFKQHDWRMSLEDKSQEPYGTFVIKEILKQSIATDSFINLKKKISKSLPKNNAPKSNFIFIGEALYLDTNDVKQLLDFVGNGNTAFISSITIPDLLMEEVYLNPCDTQYWEDYSSYYDTAVITNFSHPDLKHSTDFSFPYVYQNKVHNTYWSKMTPHIFCERKNYPVVISQSPDSIIDMAMFPYGDGAFYLQTSPIAFTNYHLVKKNGQQYTEKVFSHLQKGPIYWDDFSHVPAAVGRGNNWANHRNPLEPKDGPLDYILSQPPLAWAWYTLLALGLLYILFRAKRQQRMIPVIAKNRNTSLAFISTISRLHFTGDNHRRIALQKMDLMKAFIRSKYKLSYEETDTNFIKAVSDKAEIEVALIKKMFLLYTNIKSSQFTTDKTLIELHKLTDYFYKNCR